MQPTGKSETVRPSIGLYFAGAAPSRTPVILRLGRQNLDIPAGAADYHVADSYVLPVDAEVRAIQPHAHYRARVVSASATLPDGTRRPLILILNWDFNWQDQYRYAAPFWCRQNAYRDRASSTTRHQPAQSRHRRSARWDGDRRTKWPTSGSGDDARTRIACASAATCGARWRRKTPSAAKA
jgi:hypothetical protein